MNLKKETFIVEKSLPLLDYLIMKKKDLSKNKIKQYLKYEMIEVNNKIITKANHVLEVNDNIVIYYGNRKINNDLEILYEDSDIIAINKPSGLLSIANKKEKNITAFKMVREYVRSKEPNTYLFTIHRLDEETSGVLMFAKSEKIKHLFQDNWNKIVKKRNYIAVINGKIKKEGIFHSYLKENKNGIVYSSKTKDGKEAITEYKVLKTGKKYTLLQVNILTGRRNQIRVHFSENNTPILGDKKYHDKTKCRLMLHANLLEFVDPRTNKLVTIEAKTPQEFYEIVK